MLKTIKLIIESIPLLKNNPFVKNRKYTVLCSDDAVKSLDEYTIAPYFAEKISAFLEGLQSGKAYDSVEENYILRNEDGTFSMPVGFNCSLFFKVLGKNVYLLGIKRQRLFSLFFGEEGQLVFQVEPGFEDTGLVLASHLQYEHKTLFSKIQDFFLIIRFFMEISPQLHNLRTRITVNDSFMSEIKADYLSSRQVSS